MGKHGSLPIVIMLVATFGITTKSVWGMTNQDGTRVLDESKVRNDGSPQRFPTTYANRKRNKEIFEKWNMYTGRWVSRDEFGEEIIVVAFAPRLPRPGKDAPQGTLSGFIPKGEYEGTLFFQTPPERTNQDESVLITGSLFKADGSLTRLEANLLVLPVRQTRGSESDIRRLILQFKQKTIQKEYPLEWVSDIDDSALSTVCIIAHRGLGFAELDNQPEALRHAWYFGASGIEFDITVPYMYAYMNNGEPSRLPLTNRLVVYHPPFVMQTAHIDRIPQGFYPAEHVFEELERYSVPFIYVDPKVKWLPADDLKKALSRIISLANQHLNGGSSLTITIAAPDDDTAKFLSSEEAFQSSPYFATGQLSWTLEWTEVKGTKEILAHAQKAPSVFSFNLMGVVGSLKWPIVEWLFKDIPEQDEVEMTKKSQPLIFWTGNANKHFRGSLDAAKHPKRMGRSGEPGEIGIMTDYPHRLAYWLATAHPSTENPLDEPSHPVIYAKR